MNAMPEPEGCFVQMKGQTRRQPTVSNPLHPFAGQPLLAEEKRTEINTENDEDPLHRFPDYPNRLAHRNTALHFSLFILHSAEWQPLAESNRSYLDENQMS